MKLNRTPLLARLARLALAFAAIGFLTSQTRAGSIERLIYYDSAGSAVSNLTSAQIFPAQPSFSEQLDDFTAPLLGFQTKNDSAYSGSSFGSYTRGYLEAPTNGIYVFFVASDNASQLSLSTNETVAGLQVVAYEPGSGAPLFSGLRLSQRESAPIALTGGQKYYLELLHQAASAGSSYFQVGWRRPDGVQEIIPALHLAQYPVDLYAGASATTPVFNSYGLNGGDLPSTVATNEGSNLLLQVDVIAAEPATFQWYRNGTPVPGANLSYLPFLPVHAAANGDAYQVVVTNLYGVLTSSTVKLAVTPGKTPPAVTQVGTAGNPNAVLVSFSKPVDAATSTNPAHYVLQTPGGPALPITSASLLAGQQTVELAGNFSFQAGATYLLTISGVLDQDSAPNTLSPNPTASAFAYAPPAGTPYNFSGSTTNAFDFYGYAQFVAQAGLDDGGYVDLTDASQYETGVLQFTSPGTVDQFELSLKTRIGGASATPGDGFSINLANDLPQGIFLNQQEGYASRTAPAANRLIVAFNNDGVVNGVVSPAIIVKWQGSVVTNVPAGAGGVPPINSADGHWANVDLLLKRGGALSLTFDGALIFTNLPTGFVPVQNGQLEIAAQTGTNYETHWFHDLNLNYAPGDIGPAGFLSRPPLTNLTVLEGASASFAVVPAGASPFYYQWYFNNAAISGATNSVYSVVGAAGTAGNYSVVVSNWFSQTNSGPAALTVTPDTTPPHLLGARGLAGGINEVLLAFNKPLNPASATNTATYNLGFLTLYSAGLSADGQTVTLQTGTLERNQLYLFNIVGLQDNTAEHNRLTTAASFVATVDYAAQIELDGSIRYWRFDEPAGSPTVSSLTTGSDALSLGVATLNGTPTLGDPSLIPSEPQDPSVLLTQATGDWILVQNGVDLNTAGPYAQKSVEFWFNANTVPPPGATGLTAAAGLFEEGAQTRGLNIYLWRDPSDPDPDEAELIFNAFDNAATDGVGAPWGTTSSVPTPTPRIYAEATVQAGQTYHVVAVFNGNAETNGSLILYVNGVEVSSAAGVGLLYAHTGDVEIGLGNNLLIDGTGGTFTNFDGVIDDLSLYNTALAASTVASHYQAGIAAVSSSGPPAVSRIDTLGNPNQVLLTFNKPVAQTTATNLANYALEKASGTAIAVTNAVLLGGDTTVRLLGSFGFLVNSNYTLTVSNITDQFVPANLLTPNPTNVAFSFSAPAGTLYSFSNGLPSGVQLYGSSYAATNGGGFLDLTDAVANENGAVLFNERHDIQQFDIQFQAQLANGSTPPGAGFSVNIGTNLPAGTLNSPELGYFPSGNPAAAGLVVSFNNDASNPPAISVLWQGNIVASVPTGSHGVPPLATTNGGWAAVDINLQIGGAISVSYEGVTVISNVATGFQPLIGAQVEFAADTTAGSFETHWFNNISLNFADGSVGPVTIPANGQPQGSLNLENEIVDLAVAPAGDAPFGYQWYFNNAPVAGANGRTLSFSATTSNGGPYFVIVSNGFSSATSAVAAVSVQSDLTPPVLTNVAAYGGSLNQVSLSFNKSLETASATNLSTYSFTEGGLTVNSAVLGTNGTSVTLYTSQQQNLETNTLVVNGLLDYAAVPHPLYTNVTFQSGVNYREEALSDGPARYWRFDETNGSIAYSDVSVLDPLATAQGTYNNKPILGLPGLVPNSIGTAVRLVAAASNSISWAASEKDISASSATVAAFTNRTVEFWFKAATLPYATATNTIAPPLWIEGAGTRYLAVYLYGTDTTTTNPGSALLVFAGGNLSTTDGGGAGTPWGAAAGNPAAAVYASAPVTTNQVYHVVAVLQGNVVPASGQLALYTNGVLASSTLGAGYVYGHTGAQPRVGVGSAAFRHDGVVFAATDFYDGVIDELSLYNLALSSNRVAALYQFGVTPPLVSPATNVTSTNIAAPVFAGYGLLGGGLTITWNGAAQLQRATNATGPFTTIPGAASPYSEPATNSRAFFRLVQ